MKVTILSDVTDHRRSYQIGDVCDIPADQAARWIARGWAVGMKETAAAAVVVAATLKAPEETATLPKAVKR
jgi:hypothetical protein